MKIKIRNYQELAIKSRELGVGNWELGIEPTRSPTPEKGFFVRVDKPSGILEAPQTNFRNFSTIKIHATIQELP
jgi:hypothetical protein